MSGSNLQRLMRHVQRVQDLIKTQRERVAGLRAQGLTSAADHSETLIPVLENTLLSYRQRLSLERQKHGLPDAD